jgi:hypothetical protein
MPVSKADKKRAKAKSPKNKRAPMPASRLDIIFCGPLLFVPETKSGDITSVEVFSPQNGHPVGATFLPGVFFTDAQLDHVDPPGWPETRSFSLLDPHSYAIEFGQLGKQPPFPVSSIPGENHIIHPCRKLRSEWDVAIGISGQLSNWTSHLHFDVTHGTYLGSDAPTTATVACLERLTYLEVNTAEFFGLSKEPKEYLKTNIASGGSLIILGEIPYQSTLLHERQAVQSVARLAGLDLHLATTTPTPDRTRLMDSRQRPCGHCVIVPCGD